MVLLRGGPTEYGAGENEGVRTGFAIQHEREIDSCILLYLVFRTD